MRTFLFSFLLLVLNISYSSALDPVRCAVKYTGGGAVAVEVQLYDFGTSTNVYPGAGYQSIGSISANGAGIISFLVGKGDPAWSGISAASVTNNFMLIVRLNGSIVNYFKLQNIQLDQGIYGSEIDVSAIGLTDGNVLIGNADDEAEVQSIGGDASMTNTGSITVTKIQNRDVFDFDPGDGELLSWNDFDSRWEPGDVPPTINVSSTHTWTETQTFEDGGLGTKIGLEVKNSCLSLENDNDNETAIRFYEPSGSGNNYVSFQSSILSNDHTYIFPTDIGGATGHILAIGRPPIGNIAELEWIPPIPPESPMSFGGMSNSIIVFKPDDESVFGSSRLQDDDHLELSWGNAPGTYVIKGMLYIDQIANAGYKLNFTTIGSEYPSLAKYIQPDTEVIDLNTDITSFGRDFEGGIFFKLLIKASDKVNGVKLRFAQANSDGKSFTVKKGSYLKCTKID